jgi:hypothetical protein
MLQRILVLTIILLGGASLIYGSYYSLRINGLRGEMRLMLSYLHTLEHAAKLEKGEYLFFEQFYGARIDGQDHCQQPPGAARLGFFIRWCHEPQGSVMRYAYRVLPVKRDDQTLGFKAIAHSGSDRAGRSFICFFEGQQDIWQMSENRQLTSVRACD